MAEVTHRSIASKKGFVCVSHDNESEQLSSLEQNRDKEVIKCSLDKDETSVKKPGEGKVGSTKSIAVGVVAVALGAAIARSITTAVNAYRMQYSNRNDASKTSDVHECDENFTIGSNALPSVDTYDLPVESEHSLSSGFFAELFSCGGQGQGDDSVDYASQISEAKIEELKRKYEDSIKRRKQEERKREILNEGRKGLVKSTIIAKTKLYPGFEVTDKHGKQNVSTNSKSRAIKDMVKMLKRNKLSKKKKSSKLQIENSDSLVLQHKNETILERVTISTS